MKNSALKHHRHRSLKNRAGTIYYRYVSKVEQVLSAIERKQQANKNRLIEKATNETGRLWTF